MVSITVELIRMLTSVKTPNQHLGIDTSYQEYGHSLLGNHISYSPYSVDVPRMDVMVAYSMARSMQGYKRDSIIAFV